MKKNNNKKARPRGLERLLSSSYIKELRRQKIRNAVEMATKSLAWWEREMFTNLERLDELEFEKQVLGKEGPEHDLLFEEVENSIIYLLGKKWYELKLMDKIEKDVEKNL